MARLPLVAVIVSCTLIGCGAGRLNEVESNLKQEMSELRGIQAQQTASINELQADMRSLQGKLEEIGFQAQGKTRELENRLNSFGSRVPPPEGVPAELLSEDEERIARNTGAAADLYRKGLEQIRLGDFDGARATFESFVSQNPDTAFSDNALFWTGVALEKLGQYDRAIVSYSDVFKNYPAEDRAAAAMYRLGECFIKMDSASDAQLTFQKVIDDYPRSEFSARAKARLQEMRATSRKSRRS